MTKRGLVAFFDILGYQNIIDNNDIDQASEIVSSVLARLPSMAASGLSTLCDRPPVPSHLLMAVDNIEARLISDSILVDLPIAKDAPVHDRFFYVLAFLLYCAKLTRASFDSGLPVRGAIDYGDFYLTENCFAGKPIIDCYRLGQQMQCAGCVMTEPCSTDLNELMETDAANLKWLHPLLFSHLVPLKGGEQIRLSVLDWVHPFKEWEDLPLDVRAYVVNSFHMHNKDISTDVMRKVDNTEVLIRHALSRKQASASKQEDSTAED